MTIELPKEEGQVNTKTKRRRTRQCNDQKKKDKRTKNNLENTTQKTKDRAIQTTQKTVSELGCSSVWVLR